MERIVGKTVASVEYKDARDEGMIILFKDGTRLEVTEARQAGEILVKLDGQEIQSDAEKEAEMEDG